MTQSPQEATVGGSNDPVVAVEPTLEDRFAAFAEDTDPPADVDPQDDPDAADPAVNADDAADDDLTADDIADDDADDEAAKLPPIAPPVSWTAEKKEKFAELPRDLQEYVAERETDREKFVQSKAQEAAQTRSQVEQAAMAQIVELQRAAAEQLDQYAQQLTVQKPDPRLIASDPELYAHQAAAYEHYTAQREQAQRDAEQARNQVSAYEREMESREAQAFRQTLADQLPDYLDPTKGPKLQQELGSIALELGYSAEQIAEARASDILAMQKVSQLKAKADKYDTLMAKKMETVRAAKALPKVAKPGVAQPKGTAVNARYQADRQAMKQGDAEAAKRVFSSFV
jgi:hypothetical protein